MPWVFEADRVALVEEANPPLATECHYGTTAANTIQDTVTGFAPGHVFRLPDAGLPWLIGDFNPFFGDDTPGVANALGTGACCSPDPMGGVNDLVCGITDRANCETTLFGVYKGRDVTCLDVGNCRGACCVIDVAGSTCVPNVFPGTCADDPAVGGLGGIFAGDASVCTPEPCTALCTDIFTGRADSEAAGATVDVSARFCDVTNPVVVSSATNVNNPGFPQFQLMDASGPDGSTAVTVFGGQALINGILTQIGGGDPANALGTIVQMSGAIGEFNGLAEFQDGSFGGNLLPLEVLNSGTPGGGMALIPPPVPVTFLDFQGTAGEAVESENVSLECFAFVDEPLEVPPIIIDGVTTFLGGGAGGNFTITDGINTAVFRVGNLDLGIAGTIIPTGMVSATGLFGQFNSYQILPRSLSEIDAAPTNCGPTGACTFTAQPGLCRQLTADICTFVGGLFDPNGICTVTCGTCAGDMNGDNFVNDLDVADFVTTLLAGGPSLCADVDPNPAGVIDGGDIQMFIDRALVNTDCLAGPPATNLISCTPGLDCAGDAAGWCIYTVTNVNVFGPPCNSLGVGVPIQIPCTAGSCNPLGTPPETFNWVDGNAPGQNCFFEAERTVFAGCDAGGLGVQPFNFAP